MKYTKLVLLNSFEFHDFGGDAICQLIDGRNCRLVELGRKPLSTAIVILYGNTLNASTHSCTLTAHTSFIFHILTLFDRHLSDPEQKSTHREKCLH